MPQSLEINSEDHEQLLLPIEVRPESTVFWIHAYSVAKRRWLLGKRAATQLLLKPGSYEASMTKISVDDIENLADPNLRYALRFQHAADAAGSYYHTPYSSSGHHVMVEATDAALTSELLGAGFTGTNVDGVDTFLENLRRFEPGYQGDYGKL